MGQISVDLSAKINDLTLKPKPIKAAKPSPRSVDYKPAQHAWLRADAKQIGRAHV